MVVLGIDTHKRTHTVVAIDDRGRKLAERTLATNSRDHLDLVAWADRLDPENVTEQVWAVEDCRHLSRRLERDLLHAGRRVVRVHPKLMAHVRDSARTYGKSDPIDALAVARAALREPDLPAAHLDGPARNVRLLVDHRDDLVAERTRVINRLRWHLHELDPDLQIPARAMHRAKHLKRVESFLADTFEESASVVVRLARELAHRCADLTEQIGQVERDIEQQIEPLAPALLAITGCGHLTAAKILGETAGIDRFHSKDAYARYTGTAPLPVWSGNKERHRLSRVGNRQLNAALHRIAITQARYHPGARQLLDRRRAAGDSTAESLRVLKRRLSDVVYQALRTDPPALRRQDPAGAAAA